MPYHAILWTIGSREFVCPVWDEEQQRLAGIFALDNLKRKSIQGWIVAVLVSPETLRYINDEAQRKSISGERVAYANQLVDALSALDDFVFSSDQVALDSDEMDELIHQAMLSLGPLINMTTNIDLPNVSREPQSTKEATLGNWARFPMFVLDVDDPNQPGDSRNSRAGAGTDLQRCTILTTGLISPTKQKLLARGTKGDLKFEPSELKTYDSNTELHQIVTEFSKLSRPLFVKNEEEITASFSHLRGSSKTMSSHNSRPTSTMPLEPSQTMRPKTASSINSARYAMPCLPTNRKKRKKRSTRFVMLWFVQVEAAGIGPGPIWPSRIETNIGPACSLTMEHVETLAPISGAKRPPSPRGRNICRTHATG